MRISFSAIVVAAIVACRVIVFLGLALVVVPVAVQEFVENLFDQTQGVGSSIFQCLDFADYPFRCRAQGVFGRRQEFR